MANAKEELESKIKNMTLEQLKDFEGAAKNTGRLINVFGIGVIFLIIVYTNVITLIAGSIMVYIFSNVGVGVSNSLSVIRQQIEKCKS
jgi:hypothetical protein